MVNWALPKNLYFLIALPVLFGLILLFGTLRQRSILRAIEPVLLPRIQPERLRFIPYLKTGFFFLALFLVTVALARPRWGVRMQPVQGRGIGLVVALDASKSMLADDIKPNRLTRAKAELASLIDELAGNAVGITAFAGDCYVLCPLTTDLDAAKLFLDIISPDLMPVPGTDFGKAIEKSISLFNPGSATRALVLVTDGEDLGKNTIEAVMAAKEAGVRIYPVAISTPEGAPIPESTEAGVVYKKDKSGNVVISRMDERKLILIAQATGGRFYRLEGFSPGRLIEELQNLKKEELGGGEFSGYVERFQGFLLAGLVLFFLALCLPEKSLRLPVLGLKGVGGVKE
jgi:Ca-activated chloride channel family protein